ncbi:MAG TPA: DUF2322 family protein [Methylophilaceae bacterium]|nr:DUF2322 family protein [Methylophilaceae bacterium]
MHQFSDILPTLPSIDHLQAIELYDTNGSVAGIIENKPGSSGSVKVYHHLWKKWGCINSEAAKEGLSLYAEHTDDARANPGKHPNIDRLFEVIEQNATLTVETIPVGVA